jgi:predicted nucleic acid-binding protein
VTVIIDASVLSAYLLKESDSEKVRKLLLEGTFATELIIAETINAVLTALRRGLKGEEEAIEAIEILLDFVNGNIKLLPMDEDLISETFRIGKENKLTSYDSSYIAVAKKLRGSLVSRDPKQLEVAKKCGVKVIEI